MKRILFIVFCLLSLQASLAQDYSAAPSTQLDYSIDDADKWKFGIPPGVSLMIGFCQYFNPLKGDYWVENSPRTTFSGEIDLSLLYIGFDTSSKKTGHDVYGYEELVETTSFRLGPNLSLSKGSNCLFITPFLGGNYSSVRDQSNNSVGARTKYGTHAKSLIYGCRFAYVHKSLILSAHASNRDFGANIGFFINFYEWFHK